MDQQQFGFDLGDGERRDGPLFEAAFIRREALALIASHPAWQAVMDVPAAKP